MSEERVSQLVREAWNKLPPACDDVNGLLAEIERLRERLEMTHVHRIVDGKMTRVPVEPGSIPDGIDCRNETIKLQDAEIKRLRAALKQSAAHLEIAANTLSKAGRPAASSSALSDAQEARAALNPTERSDG